MSTIILRRDAHRDDGTFGVLMRDAEILCVTCEDPWNDNQAGISCIPPGEYECEPYSSAKYPDVWQVMDVPGRSLILIHQGNTEDDTRGCILVGESFGHIQGKMAVLNSRKTLTKLKTELPDYFTLRIVDAEEME